jgi:eukaryotic-like serine/threonine-protein kinase
VIPADQSAGNVAADRDASPAAAVRPSWELEPGDEIAPGRSILKPLGGGSAYEVFLVWDERLLAVLVAKVLRPDHADDPSALRDLERESDALTRLAHPVLVRGFDAVLDGPYPHVLIEHLEGPTLRRLVKRGGPLPPEQLLPLVVHVAAALHYMAVEEIVHLDVKPANIIMGIPPRLIDLSIAQTLERAARVRAPLGTDAYMPPEQCAPSEHPGAIGPASDVWGLGATLHHALAGEVPFPREGEERFPQLEHGPRPLPRRTPAELCELLAACLAYDPADRPSASDVVLALEPLVAGLPRKLTLGRFGARAR